MKQRIENYGDFISRIYRKPGYSKSVTFQVTDACNLACKYCYQINKGTRRMSFETAKKFVDLLLSGEKGVDAYVGPENSKAVILEFIGGEPFLEIDLIDKIVDYFREQAIMMKHPWADNFCISICSNGVLYRDPKVQAFLEKNKHRLSFSVTIDGNKELHDSCRVFPDGKPSYDIAWDAASDWMNRGYYMGSKITIAPGNLKYLNQAIDSIIANGYDEIFANCVFEEGWTQEHAKEFYRQLKELADKMIQYDGKIYCSLFEEIFFKPKDPEDTQNWCGGNGVMLACDPDGKLYPCLRYMESSLGKDQPGVIIGSVDEGIGQCERHKNCIECIQAIDRKTQSTDDCYYCPLAEGCSWCQAYNYQFSGNFHTRATFICEMHKARALANVYYWNKLYEKLDLDHYIELYCPKEWALNIIDESEWDMLCGLVDKQKNAGKDKKILAQCSNPCSDNGYKAMKKQYADFTFKDIPEHK